jgi:alpha-methylacyl-CoA racemase
MQSLLDGVRILDFSRQIPGSYATAKLADLGADVVKVELAGQRDHVRHLRPWADDVGIFDLALNRNKRSIVLDVDATTGEGRSALDALLRTSDVMVECEIPGVMESKDLGYESVRRAQPEIIYCSISAYGQRGDYSRLPSHGANLDGMAGLLSPVTEPTDSHDRAVTIYHSTQAAGMHAAMAIAAALASRSERRGAHLEISCWESATSWQYANLTSIANTGEPYRSDIIESPRYRRYSTLDGKWVFFGVLAGRSWEIFCEIAGNVEWARDSSEVAENEIASVVASRTRDYWLRVSLQRELPITPILSPEEIVYGLGRDISQVFDEIRNPLTGVPHMVQLLPVRVNGEQLRIHRFPPVAGADTDEVLREIGQGTLTDSSDE